MFNTIRPTSPVAKVFIPCALLALAPIPAIPAAHAQEQLWITQFGTNTRDHVYALAPDGAGGVMVGGSTGGDLGAPIPDPGPYLARYDRDGNRLWINQFGAGEGAQVDALIPDGAGGFILAGVTGGNLGGPSAGRIDAWIAKFDANGNEIWIHQFGTSSDDHTTAVASDGAGGAMIAGWVDYSLAGTVPGDYDAWIGRFDSEGNQLWMHELVTSERDHAWAVASDGAGGALFAGSTKGTLGGTSSGIEDPWIARYDALGNQLWIRQFGASAGGTSRAMASDGAGGAIVTGWTGRSLGGPNRGASDIFLARYDGAGNQLWIRQFGSGNNESASALSPDGAGGVMIAGTTWGNLGGSPAGNTDVWIARYNGDGVRHWIRQFGTDSYEQGLAIATDGVGGAVIGGVTLGSLGGPPAGNIDAFIARYALEPCYADCTQSTGNGVLDIFDFLCFQGHFVNGGAYACDCDTSTGNGVCDVFDFLCFQNAFVGGCP